MTLDKNISFPNAVTTLRMEPSQGNSQGNVHGGELMKIMDSLAGIVAFKHSRGAVVTARVDELVFHKPVNIGNIITCLGQLTYVGNTSMQIFVRIIVRDFENNTDPETALSAFFTMVHLKDGKPASVPKLTPTTKEEIDIYKLGESKYLEIKSKYKK